MILQGAGWDFPVLGSQDLAGERGEKMGEIPDGAAVATRIFSFMAQKHWHMSCDHLPLIVSRQL